MYALQNQNVERKIAKQIDIKHLQKKKEEHYGSTSIDQLTNIEENQNVIEREIPEILIPKDEPEPMPQMEYKDTFINNDNISLIIEEKSQQSALHMPT